MHGSLVISATDSVPLGFVYAFDVNFGEPRWKRPFERGVSALHISGENLAAVTALGELVLLDPRNGSERWRFTPDSLGYPAGYVPAPIVTADGVFFFAPGGKAHSLDGITGRLIWTRDLGAEVTTSPVLRADNLVIGLGDGRVILMRATDGEPAGARQIQARPFGFIQTDGDCSFVLTAPQRNSFSCLTPDLTERWQRVEPEEWTSFRPALWRGAVLVGDDKGQLYALNRASGAVEWTYQANSAIRGLFVDGEVVYVGTIRGTVVALSIR